MEKIIKHFVFPVIALIYILGALLIQQQPIGESDDYMLASIALMEHHGDSIHNSDIEKAYKIFPEHQAAWKSWKDGNANGGYTFNQEKGKWYTFYFPTYSLFVIPFIYLLQFLKVSQTYAFPLANAIFLFMSFVFLMTYWKTNFFTKSVASLILMLSPIMSYIYWPSAECMISALLVLTVVCLFNKWYLRSMLFYSLASTLNIAIAPFCIVIYCFVLLDFVDRDSISVKNIFAVLIKNKITLAKLILLNGIVFVPIVLNIIRWGRVVVMSGMGTFDGWLSRAIAYLVDLNFGFLPYFPFICFALFILIFSQRERWSLIIYLLSIILILAAFSLMGHINCGHTGIHRYVAWTSILITLGVCWYANFIDSQLFKKLVAILLCLSVIISLAWSIKYRFINAVNSIHAQYVYFSPLAKFILDLYPDAYNPLFSTFNSRINHVDGGYNLPQRPIYYVSKQGFVKKILLCNYMVDVVKQELKGNVFFDQTRDVSEYYYININSDSVVIKQSK